MPRQTSRHSGSAERYDYDPDADIAWLPTGESDDVVSERVPHGLHNFDRASHQLVAIEVWAASARLPPSVLGALSRPSVIPTDTSWKAIQQRLGTRSATIWPRLLAAR